MTWSHAIHGLPSTENRQVLRRAPSPPVRHQAPPARASHRIVKWAMFSASLGCTKTRGGGADKQEGLRTHSVSTAAASPRPPRPASWGRGGHPSDHHILGTSASGRLGSRRWTEPQAEDWAARPQAGAATCLTSMCLFSLHLELSEDQHQPARDCVPKPYLLPGDGPHSPRHSPASLAGGPGSEPIDSRCSLECVWTPALP